MRYVTVIAVIALTVTACLGNDFAYSLNGSRQLMSGEVDGTSILISSAHPVTLTINGDQIGGIASCNHYSGEVDLGGFYVSGLSSTEMACSLPGTMEAEALYLQGLSRVDTAGLEPPNMVLSGEDVRLEFEPLPPIPTADLLGTVWVLIGRVNGESVSSVSGERATLELFTDGSFIGSTGCRDISGSYIVTGAEVQSTNFVAHGVCSLDLVLQDSQVISALEGGFRVEIEEDQLTTWSAGGEGLIYRADP